MLELGKLTVKLFYGTTTKGGSSTLSAMITVCSGSNPHFLTAFTKARHVFIYLFLHSGDLLDFLSFKSFKFGSFSGSSREII